MRIVKNEKQVLVIEDFCPIPILSTFIIFSYFIYMLVGMNSTAGLAASFVILLLAIAVSFVIERRRFHFDKDTQMLHWSVHKVYHHQSGQIPLSEVKCAEILELQSRDCSNFSIVIKLKKEYLNITNYSNTDINNQKNREVIQAINRFIMPNEKLFSISSQQSIA